MEQISSRARLVELINKGETYTGSVSQNKKTFYTVILNKTNNEHYRIEWGEVKDKDGIAHIWFKPNLVCVKFDAKNANWMSAVERKEARKTEYNAENVWKAEEGLVFLNGEARNLKELSLDKLELIGGRTGAGKSMYIYREIAKSLKNNLNVLLFDTENLGFNIVKNVFRALDAELFQKIERKEQLNKEDNCKVEEITNLMTERLRIDSNPGICTEYILREMGREHSATEEGLGLVVIDSLHLISDSKESIEEVGDVHKYVDQFRQEIGCKVVIAVQLGMNF